MLSKLWNINLTYSILSPVSISGKKSSGKFSWSLKSARLTALLVSFWNLIGTSEAVSPRCLSNFRAIGSFSIPVSRLRDFTRSYDNAFYRILKQDPAVRLNKKMSSYQYRKSHCGDKTVVRSSYLHNGISYTGKMLSLYWIRAQVVDQSWLTFHSQGYPMHTIIYEHKCQLRFATMFRILDEFCYCYHRRCYYHMLATVNSLRPSDAYMRQ